MLQHRFNLTLLYREINDERLKRGFSWRRVSQETGIGQEAFIRLSKGRGVGVHSLIAIFAWLGDTTLRRYELSTAYSEEDEEL